MNGGTLLQNTKSPRPQKEDKDFVVATRALHCAGVGGFLL
jgi:hypothetical protein